MLERLQILKQSVVARNLVGRASGGALKAALGPRSVPATARIVNLSRRREQMFVPAPMSVDSTTLL